MVHKYLSYNVFSVKYVLGAKKLKLQMLNDVLKVNWHLLNIDFKDLIGFLKDSCHFATQSSADIRVVLSCYTC